MKKLLSPCFRQVLSEGRIKAATSFPGEATSGIRNLRNRLLAMLFLLTALTGIGQTASGQTVISTESGTGFTNNLTYLTGNSFITFAVENTNSYDVVLTQLDQYWDVSNTGTVPTLWYSSTSLTGSTTLAAPTWLPIDTGTAVSVPTSGYYPTLTNLNFVIPAGAQYRFAVQSSNGVYYTGATAPSPTTLNGGGLNLKVHNATIGTGVVGYSGTFPSTTNNPRSFIGRIHFQPTVACTAPPTGGQAVSSVTTSCPGTNFNLSLTGASFGAGMTYQWQSSANGSTGWTDITGATTSTLTASQTTTTYYRAQLTCSGQTASSNSVQVTTSATPLAGTYTINKNAPASATNYQSFATAIAALECASVSGAVTFNVVAGTGPYNEQVVIPAITGATAARTITFNGNGNTISANPGTTHIGVITLDGADYVKFDNFTIALDAAATAGCGVQLKNAANNNTFTNNTINIPLTATSTSINGIVAGTSATAAGNNTNNSRFANNTFNGGYYAIRINGNTGALDASNNQIVGNTFKDSYAYNIYLDDNNGTLVEGNDISRPTRATVTTFYGIYTTGASRNLNISKNRIHNPFGAVAASTSSAYGIYFSSADAPAGAENIVKNNLIYDINTNGLIYGIYNTGSDGTYIYHNTIDLTNATNTGTVRGFYQLTSAANIKFMNNIVTVNSGATGTKHAIYFGTPASDIASNNNILWVNPTAANHHIGYLSANATTLADWKAVNSNAYDQNSVSADPQYQDAANGNFKPTNSTVNNIGQVLAAVTDDITGAPRSTTAPDPGAYEFTPAANDAGITAFVAPVSPTQPNVSTPVQVTLKNFGSAALTNATITWTINGVAQPNYNWTGNLVNNQTANVTIGNYTFTTGSYAVNVCTTNPNGTTDANTGNDCFTTDLIACSALAGNYTINKNAPASATNFQSMSTVATLLSNCGISAPVTFNVAAGTGPYNEQVVLGAISGASALNTITFNGNGNTVSANPGGAGLGVITLDGADYVKFDNFTIALDAAATAGVGVQLINAANYNTFSNNTINIPLTATSTSINGIVAGATATTAGNNTNFSKFLNNTINGGYYALRINGNTGAMDAKGNQIIGNTFRDSYVYNIYLDDTDSSQVIGNDISRPTRGTTSTFYGIYATGSTQDLNVSKNRIYNPFGASPGSTSAAYGIYLSSADAQAGTENIVKNNLVYDFNTNGTIYGIYNAGSDGAYFYHNTIDLTNASNTGTVRGFYQLTSASNIRFNNNIVIVNSGATGTKHALYFGTPASDIASNNNVLWVDPAATNHHIGYLSANATTLADWKSVNTNAYDQNSVSENPQFVDPATGNYKPTNSQVNNIGKPLPAVTDDITGATRSTTTPDPGAYEFTPAANDAGVIALVSPVSPVQPGVSVPVQVTIQNYGLSALTSTTITWTVNGVAQPNYSWVGNLPTGQTTTATIGNYTFASGSFTLNACTSIPNGGTDANPANDCLINNVIACNPLAGNYTINKNAPVSATNFQSLTDAAQRLNSCGVSAAVTFTVASGTGPYNEQLLLKKIAGTSATNTITFEGNGNTVSATPTTSVGVVTLDSVNYVTVNNFILTLDASATSGWGVQLLNAANYNTISNNTINLPLTSTSTNVNGIVTGMTATTAGNHTNYSKFMNNTINGGYYAIRINGNTGGLDAVGNQIIGNTIKDTYIYNIYLDDTDSTLVEGNDISRPTRTTVSTFYGIYMTGVNAEATISKNRIYNTHGAATTLTGASYGIYTTGSDSPAGSEAIVKNNLIYNFNNTGTIYGLYNSGSDGVYYYHNTIDLSNAANTGTVRGFYQVTAADNIRFVNNIVTLRSGATGTKHALYFGTAGSTIVSNNNVLFVTPTATNHHIGYYSANATTLANWQAVNNSAYDQNSVAVDPQYANVATGDLTPTNTSINNTAQPLAEVTDDIMGLARNSSTPDPGAYEFLTPTNDAGVTAIVSPVSACGLTAQEVVTITVVNFGANTLSSIPVSYTVNQGSPVTAVIPGPVAPGATVTYSFTATINMSTTGGYIINACTNLTGDINPANDCTTKQVGNSSFTSLPITINFEAPATGLATLRAVTNSKSALSEGAAASLGTGSTQGLIMEGIDNPAWVLPILSTDPWTINPDNFSAVYFCFNPAGGAASDPLWLSFDLKQLFKDVNANTNFRVTVNGTAIGGNVANVANTYRPPFDGVGGTTEWTKIYLDLSAYKSEPNIQIGFESSVSEGFANGTGPANLVDNIRILRVDPTGTAKDILASQLNVYPNPSTGIFNVALPQGKAFEMEVMDLTGRTILKQKATANAAKLDLSTAAKGVYLLKVSAEGTSTVKRVVVE